MNSLSVCNEFEDNTPFPGSIFCKPNTRYINDFLHLKCAPDLILAKVFPNAKEITESLSMYWGVVNHISVPYGIRRDDPKVTVYVVGDGKHPRTGMMFAYRSAWNVISIDPSMDSKWPIQREVNRLTCYKFNVESLLFLHGKGEQVIVVLPHSHATIPAVLSSISAPNLHIISMPCCVKHDLSWMEPTVEYIDEGVWSPRNTIKVWNDVYKGVHN
jgi:hypothetical protein